MNFKKLTDKNGKPFWVNLFAVTTLDRNATGDLTCVSYVGEEYTYCKETPEEILA